MDFQSYFNNDVQALLRAAPRVAVAFSGGPDSRALLEILDQWVQIQGGPEIHALHVDHGLRPESGAEAKALAALPIKNKYVKITILKWDGEKPGAALQEEARKARYALMAEYCRAYDIAYLFLAHHRDDQAETFLFRLAKGSGLDGLSCMQEVQNYSEGLTLVRPFLDVDKDELISFCDTQGLEYLQDPSNQSEAFARVRLRQSRAVLEAEGLSAKRLVVTAKRLSRARLALDELAEKALETAAIKKDTICIVLNLNALAEWPDEVALRVILQAVGILRPGAEHAPRMEKMEDLFYDLRSSAGFRKRTLGGLVFTRDDRAGEIIIVQEGAEP